MKRHMASHHSIFDPFLAHFWPIFDPFLTSFIWRFFHLFVSKLEKSRRIWKVKRQMGLCTFQFYGTFLQLKAILPTVGNFDIVTFYWWPTFLGPFLHVMRIMFLKILQRKSLQYFWRRKKASVNSTAAAHFFAFFLLYQGQSYYLQWGPNDFIQKAF